MKRITVTALFVLGLASVVFIGWLRSDPDAPTFRVERAPISSLLTYSNLSYEFLSSSPFEGGKMWIYTYTGTNAVHDLHCFYYDIDRKQILGEVLHARPVFMNRDQSRLLCVQRGPRHQGPFRRGIAAIIKRISGNTIQWGTGNDDAEVFWVLDLKRNSANRIGDLSQHRGAGSSFQPSPDFRFGYNKPTASSSKPEFFVCDVEKKTLRKVVMDGFPAGWWSDIEIIITNPSNDFRLYNVLTEKSAPLLRYGQIARFLETAKIPGADPNRAYLFSTWTGKQYDFYFTDTHKKWLATNSFLIRLQRPDAALQLMAADFKFEWSDHLDPTASCYVFSGRQAGDRSTGVFLRDLRDNTTRTLVAPEDSRYFSLPRFYHDGVIYTRDNMLWWIDLQGSNRLRVFPPATATR